MMPSGRHRVIIYGYLRLDVCKYIKLSPSLYFTDVSPAVRLVIPVLNSRFLRLDTLRRILCNTKGQGHNRSVNSPVLTHVIATLLSSSSSKNSAGQVCSMLWSSQCLMVTQYRQTVVCAKQLLMTTGRNTAITERSTQ